MPVSDPDENDPYIMTTAVLSIERAYTPNRSTARALAYALWLSFVPHSRNSPTRKYVTIIMFITWAAVTIMSQLGHAHPRDDIYLGMTVVVFSIISHLWGFEYGVLSAVSSDGHSSDPDEGDDDG